MHEAIKEANEGKTPFGCVIARDGHIVARAYNTVMSDHDPTEHAEMNALRAACRKYDRSERRKMIVYTTCEPCPMCMGALLMGGFRDIVYGTDIPTAARYVKQIMVRCSHLAENTESDISIKGGVMEGECRELFETFVNNE
ncbi:nucleoside deaminase [Roseivirga sp. BDSF3-8]|uniref:nucleoside deaminase n=1 Tax=Roseivirga sp. BDSF3-8 TaxID=3241598 RepID=UPI00353244E9